MKVMICGKGGSGKSAISVLATRLLSKKYYDVYMIDLLLLFMIFVVSRLLCLSALGWFMDSARRLGALELVLYQRKP
ncbi:hypothetical protein J7K07_03690 [Candidatus Bathyarchaeota archaeon]|nr:hypothetical protein [Candidatus Bathyarchaeota archaeon]